MAKIDVSKISGYSEMTVEDKLKALEGYEFDDKSGEEKRLKDLVSKANSEAADYKRKLQEKMTAEESAQAEKEKEIKDLQEKYAQLLKDKQIADYTSKYISLGYDNDLAVSTATAMIDGDMDTVFKNGETFKTNLEKSIRANVTLETPKPAEGNVGSKQYTTIAEIMKIRDATERQKAISENMELFKN